MGMVLTSMGIMEIKCSSCGKSFVIEEEKILEMLPDILEYNSSLQVLCTDCGKMTEYKDLFVKQLKKKVKRLISNP